MEVSDTAHAFVHVVNDATDVYIKMSFFSQSNLKAYVSSSCHQTRFSSTRRWVISQACKGILRLNWFGLHFTALLLAPLRSQSPRNWNDLSAPLSSCFPCCSVNVAVSVTAQSWPGFTTAFRVCTLKQMVPVIMNITWLNFPWVSDVRALNSTDVSKLSYITALLQWRSNIMKSPVNSLTTQRHNANAFALSVSQVLWGLVVFIHPCDKKTLWLNPFFASPFELHWCFKFWKDVVSYTV